MVRISALQIFPNLFLGGMGKIKALRAKKFGIVDFPDWADWFAVVARGPEVIRKSI
jgi:hypothetical protein